ncbi:zinc-binding dehydrogenase [Nocardioides humi]|uniref:Zinc-binding dehydrogenase n=1 Tax=Nocardioides humi TaxID=449461 RepID=A0ABN2B2U1_9ACTN|nr:zinc-binding dehydrogenase [Nocardioides humi]
MTERSARVVTLTRFGAEPEVRSVPLPDVLEPGAVLVEVECATVCGTDVHAWRGDLKPDLDLSEGYVLGHECVGRVVAFGPGPQEDTLGDPLAVGDRLVWTGESCGRCPECTGLGEPGLCLRRRGYLTDPSSRFPFVTGSFAEYAYVYPRAERVRVPDEVKSTWASAASCALRTVVHGFERLGRIGHAQSVLIQGAGPLGLFAVAVARRAGARRIIVVGDPAPRLDVARAWGADIVVPLSVAGGQRAETVLDATDGRGPDVVIEASGSPEAFEEGFELARIGARYLSLGAVGPARARVSPGVLNRKQLTVLGTWSASARHLRDALAFLAAARGEVDFDLLLSGDYSLDSVGAALVGMLEGREVKPVIWMAPRDPGA